MYILGHDMIKRIRTHLLQCQLDQPFGFSQWFYRSRNNLIVEIEDDSGHIGWGECYGPTEVTQTAIHANFAAMYLNSDPLRNEAIWQRSWQSALDFSIKGILMGALSGLDMATMDLKGKRLGVSVSELMGGRVRDQVPCYATGMYFREQPEEQLLDLLLEEAQSYVDRGYEALKIKVGKNINFDLEWITNMRQALNSWPTPTTPTACPKPLRSVRDFPNSTTPGLKNPSHPSSPHNSDNCRTASPYPLPLENANKPAGASKVS